MNSLQGARARPTAQLHVTHPYHTCQHTQHRSRDIPPWILTPGTDHSPSRHLTRWQWPMFPRCLGQSFGLGGLFSPTDSASGSDSTQASPNIWIHVQFPRVLRLLLQSSQQQLKGHIIDRQDFLGSCCSGLKVSVLSRRPSSIRLGLFLAHSLDLSSHPTSAPALSLPVRWPLPPFPHILCSHTGSSVTLNHD